MDLKDLDRAPIKDLRVKSPSYGVRTPLLLMSREAGLFEKGDILDANTTTELVASAIKLVGSSGDIVALANKVNTVINDDGSINIQGSINVPSTEFVDLGLPSGTLWMKCNIGAKKETDYGLYFQWGDTVGYDENSAAAHSSWSTCPGNGGNSSYDESALSTWDTANLTSGVLNTSVDAAYAHTNGKAKMPTFAQIQELISETDYGFNIVDGVEGYSFTNRTDSSKCIFIPKADYFIGGDRFGLMGSGVIWSSSLVASDICYAYPFMFENMVDNMYPLGRCIASSVRGVASSVPNEKLTLPSSSGTLALTSDIEEKEAVLALSINDLNTRITNLETTISNLNAQVS